jgi:hypothetical protein
VARRELLRLQLRTFSRPKPGRNEPGEDEPAKVAELADAPDLGSGGVTHGGSSPPFRTNSSRTISFDLMFSNVPNFGPTSGLVWHFTTVRRRALRRIQPKLKRIVKSDFIVPSEQGNVLLRNWYQTKILMRQEFGNGQTVTYQYDWKADRYYPDSVVVTLPDQTKRTVDVARSVPEFVKNYHKQ